MWVCLRTRKNIISKGVQHHYQPGDWVQVGRQTAEQWIAAGDAYAVDEAQLNTVEPTSGIVIRGAVDQRWRDALEQVSGLRIAFDSSPRWLDSIPFAETLFWVPAFEIRLDLLLVGFRQLKAWQLAVPLWNYDTLADNIGSPDDRARTKAVIRDLRVPVRDTRLVYVRRCNATRDLFACWRDEMKIAGTDERLAFMRALYQIKPVVCDLPASWTGNVKP